MSTSPDNPVQILPLLANGVREGLSARQSGGEKKKMAEGEGKNNRSHISCDVRVRKDAASPVGKEEKFRKESVQVDRGVARPQSRPQTRWDPGTPLDPPVGKGRFGVLCWICWGGRPVTLRLVV